MNSLLQGVYTALVTPFQESGAVDFDSFKKLLITQKNSNVAGVVVCGTTGETPTLSDDEKCKLIKMTVAEFKGVAPVIVGVGSNSTTKTITNAKTAVSLGADGLLVVTPYYNKPTQEGLFNHFKTVANELAPTKVVLYDVPSRTGVSISVDTILRLANSCSNIIGIKDATGDLARVTQILRELPTFRVTLGEDSLFFPALCLGACGVISVASNIIPADFVSLYNLVNSGKFIEAKELHTKLHPLLTTLFIESNPVPVKEVLKYKNIIESSQVRPPLAPLRLESKELLMSVVNEVMP